MFDGPPRNPPERSYAFEPTPAVLASRARQQYVSCPACATPQGEYLFYRTGVRYVRCVGCGAIFMSPVGRGGVSYFELERASTREERALLEQDFARFLTLLSARAGAIRGAPPARSVLLGKTLPAFAQGDVAQRLGLALAPIDDAGFAELTLHGSLEPVRAALAGEPELVILYELLEACAEPAKLLDALARVVPASTLLVAIHSNVGALSARLLGRRWPAFVDAKRVFFSAESLVKLFAGAGFTPRASFDYPTTRSLGSLVGQLTRAPAGQLLAEGLRTVSTPARIGQRVAIFARASGGRSRGEKLSIVLPAYNEGRYVADVIDALLGKQLAIEKELVIVESNSQDGTRETVRRYEGRPGVQVLYEDRPRGKGHAVKTGLAAITGSIVLIQDADFEYDIDDYDALLEPILQRRTAFVLGSRSLGLDDWRVRRFTQGAFKGTLMNIAQVGFAKTYNALYQQRATDVNTMFKVFRRECLDGIELDSDGFDLDIELVCKLTKSGFPPMEVPVNYVSRGFEEGKKIRFLRDAVPSYLAFLRYRF